HVERVDVVSLLLGTMADLEARVGAGRHGELFDLFAVLRERHLLLAAAAVAGDRAANDQLLAQPDGVSLWFRRDAAIDHGGIGAIEGDRGTDAADVQVLTEPL